MNGVSDLTGSTFGQSDESVINLFFLRNFKVIFYFGSDWRDVDKL